MANPVGTACTNVVYKTPNAGVTISQHAARFTATFPVGSAIAYVPVGQLAADDLVIIEQRAQQAGLQIKPSRSLQVNDNVAGFAEFITEGDLNASTNINFAFSILRNS